MNVFCVHVLVLTLCVQGELGDPLLVLSSQSDLPKSFFSSSQTASAVGKNGGRTTEFQVSALSTTFCVCFVLLYCNVFAQRVVGMAGREAKGGIA